MDDSRSRLNINIYKTDEDPDLSRRNNRDQYREVNQYQLQKHESHSLPNGTQEARHEGIDPHSGPKRPLLETTSVSKMPNLEYVSRNSLLEETGFEDAAGGLGAERSELLKPDEGCLGEMHPEYQRKMTGHFQSSASKSTIEEVETCPTDEPGRRNEKNGKKSLKRKGNSNEGSVYMKRSKCDYNHDRQSITNTQQADCEEPRGATIAAESTGFKFVVHDCLTSPEPSAGEQQAPDLTRKIPKKISLHEYLQRGSSKSASSMGAKLSNAKNGTEGIQSSKAAPITSAGTAAEAEAPAESLSFLPAAAAGSHPAAPSQPPESDDSVPRRFALTRSTETPYLHHQHALQSSIPSSHPPSAAPPALREDTRRLTHPDKHQSSRPPLQENFANEADLIRDDFSKPTEDSSVVLPAEKRSSSSLGRSEEASGGEDPDGAQKGASKRDATLEALEKEVTVGAESGAETVQEGARIHQTEEHLQRQAGFMLGESVEKTENHHGDKSQNMGTASNNETAFSSAPPGPTPAVGATIPLPPKPPAVTTVTEKSEQRMSDASLSQNAAQATTPAVESMAMDTSGQTQLLPPPPFPTVTEPVDPAVDDTSDPCKFAVRGPDVPRSKPHPIDNLIKQYRLEDLAASVARHDPVSGEKVNRLRKSYEGYIKGLGLSGKNKAAKPANADDEKSGRGDYRRPPSSPKDLSKPVPMTLQEIQTVPVDIWQIFHEETRPITKGWTGQGWDEMDETFKTRLEKAMTFQSGGLPSAVDADWAGHLGIETGPRKGGKSAGSSSAVNGALKAGGSSKMNGVSYPSTPAAAGISRTGTPANAGGEAARPRRSGKKRRYDDDSFEGYGEGFVDDDGASEGAAVSSNDGSRSGRKKRRKGSTAAPPPTRPQGRMGSYGPGMIHQTGIGAFGGR